MSALINRKNRKKYCFICFYAKKGNSHLEAILKITIICYSDRLGSTFSIMLYFYLSLFSFSLKLSKRLAFQCNRLIFFCQNDGEHVNVFNICELQKFLPQLP